MKDYAIKAGYNVRLKNDYYEDETGTTIWQPDVYGALVELARKAGLDTIIDIGSGNGQKLIPYKDEFKFIFVDFGSNLKIIEKNIGMRGNRYIDQDFEKGFPIFPKATLDKSIVVCSDVMEHMRKPDILAKSLVDLSKKVPFVLISTPDRQRTRGVDHYGPPQNQTHVREWSMEELDTLFRSYGMKNHLTGITRSNDYEQVRRTIAILAGTYLSDLAKKPKESVNIYGSYDEEVYDFTYGHYHHNDTELVKKPIDANIILGTNEWLVSPNPLITIGSVINDATKKGYDSIDAQVIEVDPNPAYSWPQAGLIRQGHGLIGELREVRKIVLGQNLTKTTKTYPLLLTIFRRKSVRRLGRDHKALLSSLRLIDTGHLNDDYMLETVVGWQIHENNKS